MEEIQKGNSLRAVPWGLECACGLREEHTAANPLRLPGNRDKYSLVLKKSLAQRIFGNRDPLGQIVSYKGEAFTVRGVIEDPPANSSLRFDMLLPIANIPGYFDQDKAESPAGPLLFDGHPRRHLRPRQQPLNFSDFQHRLYRPCHRIDQSCQRFPGFDS
jgi:hypothetical protein